MAKPVAAEPFSDFGGSARFVILVKPFIGEIGSKVPLVP